MNRLRTAVALLAGLIILSASASAQAAPTRREDGGGLISLPYEMYRLPNGLNVILSRDTSAPVVAANLWYHVGSANEEPGRTGFAHLFEHLMFQGSANVGDDAHFRFVQEAGGTINGTTWFDRTNYFEAVPSNYLETVLWLESDRMGFFLPALTQAKLDNQRDVVKNERRQSVENVPYGLAEETILEMLYPAGHPHHHSTIGSMADLTAATLEDARSFFRKYYAPNNASLAIVGDFDPAEAKRLVERYFASIPSGPPIERPRPAPVRLDSARSRVLEDRVQLPRLYLAWISPVLFAEGDAEMEVLAGILSRGRNSRLYRRLVYQDQTAQTVAAEQASFERAGAFQVTIQAKPGVGLDRLRQALDEEIERLKREPPTDREVQRVINNLEADFIRQMQTRLNRADRLNSYYTYTGDPGFFEEEFARYRRVTPQAVQAAAARYLGSGRVVLSVVPQGKPELQASR